MEEPLDQQKNALFATPGNPIPKGARSGFVTTSDEVKIRYARWDALARPSRGSVIILHGRTDHIEKYFETIDDLRRRGFGVLTFDWRGQGNSGRLLSDPRKGHVDNFDAYLTDLETILTEVALPDCRAPHYILGHSTGGLVALLAGPALANRVRRMVLASPLLELKNLPVRQTRLQKILGFLSFIGLGRIYIRRKPSTDYQSKFISNKLTSDTRRFERNRQIIESQEDLSISHPTIGWVFAACRAMARVNSPGYSNAIGIPTLLVAGGNDQIVSPSAIESFGTRMRSGAFVTISGAKHEILQERDVYRKQFFAAFDAFVPGTEI